ncbi:MAG: sulfurtransferase [Gammaproteobacteria bacterium]|nr:sulfurtransferase [Gammaproteobacteria bacterium]
MRNLISTAALEAELACKPPCILDATWHLPNADARDAREEYLTRHLPGAVFADIDALSDQESDLPHMLPTAEAFQAGIRALGVNTESSVVVYDSLGLFSAARLWWMLKVFGHDDVRVLNGGLPKWQREGRAVESGHVDAGRGNWTAQPAPDWCVSLEETCAAELVLDARSRARFRGEAPEPRMGIASGHMPNARSLPFDQLLAPDGQMRPRAELQGVLRQVGVQADRKVITSCGSGVTAAIISLALAEIGHPRHALYDGSWTEYAMRRPADIVTGE